MSNTVNNMPDIIGSISVESIIAVIGGLSLFFAGYTYMKNKKLRQDLKQDHESRWRIDSAYNDILSELEPIVNNIDPKNIDEFEQDPLPGEPSERFNHTKINKIEPAVKKRLESDLITKLEKYEEKLKQMESTESKLKHLSDELESMVPSEFGYVNRTDFSLRTNAISKPEHIQEGEEVLMLAFSNKETEKEYVSTTPIQNIISREDISGIMNEHQAKGVIYKKADQGLGIPVYSEHNFISGINQFPSEAVSYWEEEYENWGEIIYRLVVSDELEEYLSKKEKEEDIRRDIEEICSEISDMIADEIEKE